MNDVKTCRMCAPSAGEHQPDCPNHPDDLKRQAETYAQHSRKPDDLQSELTQARERITILAGRLERERIKNGEAMEQLRYVANQLIPFLVPLPEEDFSTMELAELERWAVSTRQQRQQIRVWYQVKLLPLLTQARAQVEMADWCPLVASLEGRREPESAPDLLVELAVAYDLFMLEPTISIQNPLWVELSQAVLLIKQSLTDAQKEAWVSRYVEAVATFQLEANLRR